MKITSREKFPNYYRLEDLEQVAGFADQYETPEEFLSELALLSNLDTESKRDSNRTRSASGSRPFIRPRGWSSRWCS